MKVMEIEDCIVANGKAYFAKVFIDADGDETTDGETAIVVVAECEDGSFANFLVSDLEYRKSDA